MSSRRRAAWQDAYDAQMGLWRWERSTVGIEFLVRHFADTVEQFQLSETTTGTLETLVRHEGARVLAADPFFVSADMSQLVEAAAETFRPEPLLPTDLLSPVGFLYFAEPIKFTVPGDPEPANIAALSWEPLFGAASAEDERALLDDWPTRDHLELLVERQDGGRRDGIGLTVYAEAPASWGLPGLRPPVVPINLTPWWFGEELQSSGAAWWWRIAQTTFRLMQQQVSVHHRERPDRAQRREGRRLGFPAEREVVVVRLRREAGERREPSGEAGNYSIRWIVGHHWRNQWYPASGVHRQIWIAPYVKGPEDAPLVVRPRRAFTWSR